MAATGGVRISVSETGMPVRESFSEIAARGREVVLVRNRCGIFRSRTQLRVSAAPGTARLPW